MLKEKKYNIYAVLTDIFIIFVMYVIFKLGYLDLFNREIIKPLFVVSLGLLASLFGLLFFHKIVFISWLKHILWWFLLFTWVIISNAKNDLFLDEQSVAFILMTLLFIITLIYALIMHHRLKNKHVKTKKI